MQANLRKLQGTLPAFHAAGIAIARVGCTAVFPVGSGMVNTK